MGLGSEFSKKASTHLHCIEVLTMTFNESLGKICIEQAVFCASKAGRPKGSPFLEGPKLNKQEVGIPARDVFCRRENGGREAKG